MPGALSSSPPRAGSPALESFLLDRSFAQTFSDRTAFADEAVAAASAHFLTPYTQTPFVVAAVGGYGRRELFPSSDVDLLLVVENEAAIATWKDPLAHFLRSLWDSGLRVSHSLRTPAECAALHDENVELSLSLLDLRLLCGNPELFATLREKLSGLLAREGAAIARRLVEMARARHEKFNGTVQHLEPNIKEAPGGLRDVHLLRWLARLLPQHEAIPASLTALAPDIAFLFDLRIFLHLESKRDNNLLSFELQDEAAGLLPSSPLAPEAWMRLYYGHARHIFQRTLRALELTESQDSSLLRHFRDRRSRLSTGEFTVARDRILLRNSAETLASAEALLRLFTFAGRHGLRLSWDTQRRLQAAQPHLAAEFRDRPPAFSAWRDFFSQPHTALALEEMQEAGLLVLAFPEWRAIDTLVVRDFYHRYTVDEHTVVAIRVFDDLLLAKPGTPARLHSLAAAEPEPFLLRLALFLHDSGKGSQPGDHVAGSLRSASTVLERLHVPEDFRKVVLFLIGHHLDLSLVMTGRDLEDTATARFLTSRVGTAENLLRLTVLTYADISAVNPTAMTPWRLEQLWRVYTLGDEQLTRELSTDRIHSDPSSDPETSPELRAFLEGFPKRYLRTHSRAEIERHFRLKKKAETVGVALAVSAEAGAYILTVLARDAPGLFASLCGTLASFGMNIVKAEAASNDSGTVLDLFRFTDPTRTLELNPEEVNRLEWTVECVVRGSIVVTDLLKSRRVVRARHREASLAPAVRFDNEASDHSTLIDFIGEDRPGLLYDLASALRSHGCNIDVVLIDTEAHKAIDVFYVSADGAKLDAPALASLRADLLRAAAPPHA